MLNFQKLALPGLGLSQTYAAGPVWRGSTTRPVKFTVLGKKKCVQLYYRATAWDRRTRQMGKHGGKLGKPACAVLHALIFSFLNHKTGRLDPSYEGLAKESGYSRSTVAVALRRLRDAGIITWVRRCIGEMRGDRFVLAQERNAYAIQPDIAWKGYQPPLACPDAPEPGTWGAHPSLLAAHDQAIFDRTIGLSQQNVLATLASEADDPLTLALARLGQKVADREARAGSSVVN